MIFSLRRTVTLAAGATGLFLLVACGSSSSSSGAPPRTSAGVSSSSTLAPGVTKGSGPVSVLYAGSLVSLFEKNVGPDFASTTGYSYSGFGAGSKVLASDIKGNLKKGDVFISASPKTTKTLLGNTYLAWYVSFAKAPLIIGYSPKSSFAKDFATKPWYEVISESGFKLGTTDPKLDPKGILAAQATGEVDQAYGVSGVGAKIIRNTSIFPEETLVGRLQSGQLDAGFFYAPEAKEASFPAVGLDKISLAATYTASVLTRAGDAPGGADFLAYLFSPAGRKAFTDDGYTLIAPTITGDKTAVPAAVTAALSAAR